MPTTIKLIFTYGDKMIPVYFYKRTNAATVHCDLMPQHLGSYREAIHG